MGSSASHRAVRVCLLAPDESFQLIEMPLWKSDGSRHGEPWIGAALLGIPTTEVGMMGGFSSADGLHTFVMLYPAVAGGYYPSSEGLPNDVASAILEACRFPPLAIRGSVVLLETNGGYVDLSAEVVRDFCAECRAAIAKNGAVRPSADKRRHICHP